MLFRANDNSPAINLDNYEEFFVLYMDGELDAAQRKAVENFIVQQPHLQFEMDALQSTKLPAENLFFDKATLLSHNMQGQSLEEDLLLYLDDELPAERKKLMKLEIASNPKYQLQLEQLAATKLNAAELIVYPYKKELYRRTKSVIAFPSWMRIAAIFLLVASMMVVYFIMGSKTSPVINVADGGGTKKVLPQQNNIAVNENLPAPKTKITNEIAATVPLEKVFTAAKKEIKKVSKNNRVVEQQRFDANVNSVMPHTAARQNTINHSAINNYITANLQPAQISNATFVTFGINQAYNNETALLQTADLNNVEIDNRKGSLKSFLRKASRTITRTTGIDGDNDGNETLIGIVAVKLK